MHLINPMSVAQASLFFANPLMHPPLASPTIAYGGQEAQGVIDEATMGGHKGLYRGRPWHFEHCRSSIHNNNEFIKLVESNASRQAFFPLAH